LIAIKKNDRPPPENRILRSVQKSEKDAREAMLKQLRRRQIEGPVLDTGTGQTRLKMEGFPKPLEGRRYMNNTKGRPGKGAPVT
jgi:hypothetical protein